MSATSPCVPCCNTPQTINIPGSPGSAGAAGTNGVSTFSLTTADFVVPALNATVLVSVSSSLWMVVGQVLIVGQGPGAVLANPGPATFVVTSIPSTTTV